MKGVSTQNYSYDNAFRSKMTELKGKKNAYLWHNYAVEWHNIARKNRKNAFERYNYVCSRRNNVNERQNNVNERRINARLNHCNRSPQNLDFVMANKIAKSEFQRLCYHRVKSLRAETI